MGQPISREIDWTKVQAGQIWLTTSLDGVGNLIRPIEMNVGRFKLTRFLDIIFNQNKYNLIPTHSLMVIDPIRKLGAEMNWPKPTYIDLSKYEKGDLAGHHVCSAFLCPWLDDKYNDASQYLLEKCIEWWDYFIKIGSSYGVKNFAAFLLPVEEDKDNFVCSQATTQCLIQNLICEGYDCRFPEKWIVSNNNYANVGLVSPYDQYTTFNKLGWNRNIFKN